MRLTKEEFITYVNKYRDMSKEEEKITEILDVDPEWKPGQWVDSYYDFLNDMCELKEKSIYGTILDWRVFETKFGTRKNKNLIVIDNKEIRITNTEELYDYIMKNEVER